MKTELSAMETAAPNQILPPPVTPSDEEPIGAGGRQSFPTYG